MTARSPLQQLQNYGDSMGLTIGFIWVYGNFMGFNGVQWDLMGFSVVNSMPQTIPNRSSCWYSPDRRWYKMTPKWLVKGLVFYWVYHITRFAMPTASHVSGMASSLPKLHISTIRWQHLHHITGSWFDRCWGATVPHPTSLRRQPLLNLSEAVWQSWPLNSCRYVAGFTDRWLFSKWNSCMYRYINSINT